MGTFNGCDRILKEDVRLEKLYLKTMDNQLSNYSVTSITSRQYCFYQPVMLKLCRVRTSPENPSSTIIFRNVLVCASCKRFW